MTSVRIYKFVLYGIVICSIATLQFAVPQSLTHEAFGYDAGIADNTPAQGSVVQGPRDNETPSFMWIIGEVALGIITAVLLLIIYSWHLRKVVGKKTLELKNLNTHLEDKVEERTLALKESREEYKAMYVHAEEERKRAKVALKSERDAIRQNLNFIDMISHEYRTPLSVLSSSIDIIHKKCDMIEYHDFDDQLRKMRISIKRLIDIFDSSLGKERVDHHTPQLQIETLDLSQIIKAAIELARTAYMSHRIMFNADFDNQIQIIGDEKLLITVFSNIFDNACKYSEPEEQILINLNSGEDYVQIITIDSGIGIDEDEIPFVFEKYFRSQRTGVKQGAGVGLFLVEKIIELHKGSIKMTSQRNMGTQMSVCLPMEKKV